MNSGLYAHIRMVVRAEVVLASLLEPRNTFLSSSLEVGARISGPIKALQQKSDVISLMCLFFK